MTGVMTAAPSSAHVHPDFLVSIRTAEKSMSDIERTAWGMEGVDTSDAGMLRTAPWKAPFRVSASSRKWLLTSAIQRLQVQPGFRRESRTAARAASTFKVIKVRASLDIWAGVLASNVLRTYLSRDDAYEWSPSSLASRTTRRALYIPSANDVSGIQPISSAHSIWKSQHWSVVELSSFGRNGLDYSMSNRYQFDIKRNWTKRSNAGTYRSRNPRAPL